MPWLNGTVHETSTVPFDSRDRGLLLGDGVFDTALVLGGRLVWRQAHVARLVAAARTLGYAVDAGTIEAAIDGVLDGVERGILRVTVTRGVGPRGLVPPDDPVPTVLAAVAPLPASHAFGALRLDVAAIRRNDTSPTSRLKSLCYLDAVVASAAARRAGYDDVLFVNTCGHVACASTGNVFALLGDRLVTPPLADGVVDGIVRGALLRHCSSIGLEAMEASLSIEDLHRADAVFVTNSVKLVAPVTAVGTTGIAGSRAERRPAMLIARLVSDETGVAVSPSLP